MKKQKAIELSKLLEETEKAEQVLLIKRNRGLYSNLKNYIKYKQKIAEYSSKENNKDN